MIICIFTWNLLVFYFVLGLFLFSFVYCFLVFLFFWRGILSCFFIRIYHSLLWYLFIWLSINLLKYKIFVTIWVILYLFPFLLYHWVSDPYQYIKKLLILRKIEDFYEIRTNVFLYKVQDLSDIQRTNPCIDKFCSELFPIRFSISLRQYLADGCLKIFIDWYTRYNSKNHWHWRFIRS